MSRSDLHRRLTVRARSLGFESLSAFAESLPTQWPRRRLNRRGVFTFGVSVHLCNVACSRRDHGVVMGAFDYLCVPLTCPRCGTAQAGEDPFDLECQTKARARPDGSSLHLGELHELLADLGDHYWRTVDIVSGSRVRIIDEWACSTCGMNYLWVKALWSDGMLTAAHEGDARTPSEITHLPPADFRAVLSLAEAARWTWIREEDARTGGPTRAKNSTRA